MKKVSKLLIALVVCGICVLLPACGSGEKSNDQEKILESVPEELKDTSVIKNDEEDALNKLNTIIDTSSKK